MPRLPLQTSALQVLARYSTLTVMVLFALTIVGVQIWASIQNTRQVSRIVEELRPLPPTELSGEKTRQEVLSLRIQNELRGYFWSSLVNSLSPMVAGFVALFGAWLGLRNYLETRDKERLDRAAGDLRDILDNLVSDQARKRAVGVVGLQHFLTPDKQEYHLRVLSALLTAARLEEDTEVIRSIRIAAEQAVATLPEKVLQQVSWQGAKLGSANFSGHQLRRLDLRDATFEDADLTRCDFSDAVLTNARLNGARLDECVFHRASLAYGDFAGASLVSADLRQAVLSHAKVWGMNLARADLRQAVFEPEEVPWELTKGWRDARYDEGVLERLIARYGPNPSGARVLMLMWEIPPLVAGGTWTACFHLVRQLRRRGADVTVAVPWDEASILPSPFGCEVKVIPLGIVPTEEPVSPYGPARPSGYGAVYGAAYSSVYGARMPGSAVLWIADEFRKRVLRLVGHESFELIHAHDWVTFEAAEAAALQTAKPWIAHFHSTEVDRRAAAPDLVIERIERQGAVSASHLVAPSRNTASRLQERYRVAESKVGVVPNALSSEDIPASERGSFETKRVIFIGRLTSQKAPDRFLRIAQEVSRSGGGVSFWVFGSGEEAARLGSSHVALRGPIAWSERGKAYREASAVIVPSRSEPFGMVVLEAMQHGVPVMYPQDSGVAEVIRSGIRFLPEHVEEAVEHLQRLLTDWQYWMDVVQEQVREIADYPARGYEQWLLRIWEASVSSPRASASR